MDKENIQVFQGDCLELMKRIPDKSVDLVTIDPPYEFAQHGGGGAFGSRKREYHNELEADTLTKGFDTAVLDELVRVMRKVNIYIWCNKEQIKQYLEYFEGCNMDLLTWHKTNPVPTCNNKYLSDTEYLLFFREKGVKVYGNYHTKRKFYVTQTNKKDKEKYIHPTVKAVDIMQNIIINSSQEGECVLDCFMGTGTTGAACVCTGRRFIGIEKEQKYFEIAKQRIEEAAFSYSYAERR